ncbi:MAG TPA: AMP-binding protein [Bacillota bacterium]|nr:AMP-binding protein [Bacillota bacterium]
MKKRPWHDSYQLGAHRLKTSLAPYPQLPLFKILDRSASKYPLSTAIEYRGYSINYRKLLLLSNSLAAALADLGIKKGDRVATILPNCPQYIISTFAILKAGAVHVPCSFLHPPQELAAQIRESGAKGVICPAEFYALFRKSIPALEVQVVIVTSERDFAPGFPPLLFAVKGTHRFRDLVARYKPHPPQVHVKPREDLAYLAFTGGATGQPKGVMLSHFNRLANVLQGFPWMMAASESRICGRGSVMIPIPLFHMYGDWVMLSAINWGLKIILVQDPRDTDSILELISESRPFLVSMVPTQLMQLAEKDIPRVPMHIMTGAAHLPAALHRSFARHKKMPVSEGYGLTECSPVTHINLSSFSRPAKMLGRAKHSIGVPVPDTDVVLINEDTGRICSPGEEGHMYIKGPQVMLGYWPHPGSGLRKGWLPTGDIARMDRDGYFYIVDRIKEMANISGFKVYTGLIDDILFKHPAVSQAAAVGLPDPLRPGSERIKVFIKLKEPFKGRVTQADIINYCKEKCPPYAVPYAVEFRDQLPLTPTQKIFKRNLREEELKRFRR